MNSSKRRGRPTIDPDGTPSVRLNLRVTPKHFDALCARASAQHETLSALVRRALRGDLARKNRHGL
jgi:predicted HicB family RNase H-like nuclease